MVNNNLLTETDSLSLNIKSAHSNLKIKHFNTLVEMLYFYLKRSNSRSDPSSSSALLQLL